MGNPGRPFRVDWQGYLVGVCSRTCGRNSSCRLNTFVLLSSSILLLLLLSIFQVLKDLLPSPVNARVVVRRNDAVVFVVEAVVAVPSPVGADDGALAL